MNSYGVPLSKRSNGDRKQQLIEEIMKKWSVYGLEHRTILQKYQELHEYRKVHNISPRTRLRKHLLATFPDIKFLDIETKKKAEEYLSNLSVVDMKGLLSEINCYINSPIRRELKGRIFDYEHDMKRRGQKNSLLGMLPEDC